MYGNSALVFMVQMRMLLHTNCTRSNTVPRHHFWASVEGTPFDFETHDPSAVSSHWSTRSHMGEPEKAGEAIVLAYVKEAVQKRLLSIHGERNSNDVLFAFLDSHAHCLGLTPNQDSYEVAEIGRGLTEHLPGICARIAHNLAGAVGGDPVILDFDMVSQSARNTSLEPMQPSEAAVRFALYSPRTPLKQISESIRYLSSNQVSTIQRILRPRSLTLEPGASWIWSGFSEPDLEHNIMSILRKVAGGVFRLHRRQ